MIKLRRIITVSCLLTGLWLADGAASPAAAGCWDSCSAQCSGFSGDTDPGTCTSRCAAGCVDPSPFDGGGGGGGQGRRVYGAIAFSESTYTSGSSDNGFSQLDAEQKAMHSCENIEPQKPKDCKIILWFYNSCAAVAMKYGTDSDRWGADYAGSIRQAERKALKLCAAKGCVINYSYCTQR